MGAGNCGAPQGGAGVTTPVEAVTTGRYSTGLDSAGHKGART